jgi:hypothetical protein
MSLSPRAPTVSTDADAIGEGRGGAARHGQAGRGQAAASSSSTKNCRKSSRKRRTCAASSHRNLSNWSTNSRNLFSEGTGLMDNAKAMEGILEEGLTPDEVDGLLGRRTQFQSYRDIDLGPAAGFSTRTASASSCRANIRRQPPISCRCFPALCRQDADEAAGKSRVDIVRRAVDLKNVNPALPRSSRPGCAIWSPNGGGKAEHRFGQGC